MTEIKPNQDFMDDRKAYKKGQKYEVSESDAEYFTECGWVGELPEGSAVHHLEVHDGALGHESELSN